MTEWLTAEQATRRLRVSRATLYAYVSRGYVRSEPVPGTPRARRYSREDVELLRARAEERRNPGKAAARGLRWGVPMLDSALTLVADGKLYYRGHDAVELARSRTLEEVASLIWTGAFDADVFDTPLHVVSGAPGGDALPFVSRAQSVLPMVAARDPLADDLRPRGVAQTGWRIVNLLTSVAAESGELASTVEETLANAWAPRSKSAAALIRTVLILCADREVDVATFSARCVASAGSTPYAVVVAALAALDGRHGGSPASAAALWDELRRSRDLRKALAGRGEPAAGFGHPLYPDGDPRAAALLDLLPKSKELTFARALVDAAGRVLGERPNIDFALVALERALSLPPGASTTLLAIGRTVGWIGHAIEQYAHETAIRPRTRYTGERPM